MDNAQAVAGAIEMLRNPDSFDKQVYDSSVIKWLPHLDMTAPHPLDPQVGEKMRLAEEVYAYFKEIAPDAPYDAFMNHINSMVSFGSEPKVQRVLRSIRLLKTARKTIGELNSMGIKP